MNLRSHPLAIADHLLDRGIPLVIIGGHAVNAHGFARATEDVDIVFRRSSESEQSLLIALSEMNAYWIGSEIDPETGVERIHPVTQAYVQTTRMMMLGTELGWLDIFDFVPAMPETLVDELFATAIKREGRPFVSLTWLRRMKAAAGRPQDRLDLANLPLAED